MLLFTDAATSSKFGIAVGAFIFLDKSHVNEFLGCTNEELFKIISARVVYKKYFSKKSTWSEIQTMIDALNKLDESEISDFNIAVYTDCQSLCDLLMRRKEKLEKSNFITRSGKVHPNADLYKKLFLITNKFHMSIFKLKGHASISRRLTIYDKIFGILDKLSRKELRIVIEDQG